MTACGTELEPPPDATDRGDLTDRGPRVEVLADSAEVVNGTVEQAPADDDDDLREAVFRHQFAQNASGQQQQAAVYCIGVEGARDPSAPLLARFAGHAPRVLAASGCTSDMQLGVRARDDDTQGLMFRIESISVDENDPDHAVVEGGYYEAGLSASGNTYELRRENGAWRVVGDVMNWIS